MHDKYKIKKNNCSKIVKMQKYLPKNKKKKIKWSYIYLHYYKMDIYLCK